MTTEKIEQLKRLKGHKEQFDSTKEQMSIHSTMLDVITDILEQGLQEKRQKSE